MADEKHGHDSLEMLRSRVRRTVTPHAHNSTDLVDDALEASRRGMRALWLSFTALMLTAIVQAVVVTVSGSAALFGDMLHNLAGVVILLVIAFTAALVGWQAITRLSDPQEMRHTGWVALAGVIGFVGHELVTRYRITVG